VLSKRGILLCRVRPKRRQNLNRRFVECSVAQFWAVENAITEEQHHTLYPTMAILFKLVLVLSVTLAYAASNHVVHLCKASCSEDCQIFSTNCTAAQGTMFEQSFSALRFVSYSEDPTKWTLAVFNSSSICSESTFVTGYPDKCPENSCCSVIIKFNNGDAMTKFVVFSDATPNSTPITVQPYSTPKSDNTAAKIGIGITAGSIALIAVSVICFILYKRKQRANYSTI
jgi:hypothetical protein